MVAAEGQYQGLPLSRLGGEGRRVRLPAGHRNAKGDQQRLRDGQAHGLLDAGLREESRKAVDGRKDVARRRRDGLERQRRRLGGASTRSCCGSMRGRRQGRKRAAFHCEENRELLAQLSVEMVRR